MGASASSAAAVRAWTADDVAARVAALGAAFAKYEATIKANGVDGEMLLALEYGGLPTQLNELVGEQVKAFHATKLAVELRKLQQSLEGDLRQEQQAKRSSSAPRTHGSV